MEINGLVKKGQLIHLDFGLHSEVVQITYRALEDFDLKKHVDRAMLVCGSGQVAFDTLYQTLTSEGLVEEYEFDLTLRFSDWLAEPVMPSKFTYYREGKELKATTPVDPGVELREAVAPHVAICEAIIAEGEPVVDTELNTQHPLIEYVAAREKGVAHLLTTLQWAMLRNQAIDYVANVVEKGNPSDVHSQMILSPIVMELLIGRGVWLSHDGFEEDSEVRGFNMFETPFTHGPLTAYDFIAETNYRFWCTDGVVYDVNVTGDIPAYDPSLDEEQLASFFEVHDKAGERIVAVLSRLAPRLQFEPADSAAKQEFVSMFVLKVMGAFNALRTSGYFYDETKESLTIKLIEKYLSQLLGPLEGKL